MLALKSKEKMMNDENARPSTLLKLESTTDIFIEQVHKFQNSYFKETRERLLLFYEKHVF